MRSIDRQREFLSFFNARSSQQYPIWLFFERKWQAEAAKPKLHVFHFFASFAIFQQLEIFET